MYCADENLKKIEILNNELYFKEQIIEGLEATISNFELKCSICFDYMSNPCTISCRHTFCYICLYTSFKKQKKECPTCHVKITQEPVLSFVIKDVIEYFIKIKSSDEEKRLKEKSQEFKAISNPWENLFLNSKLKNNRSYEEIGNDEIDIEDDTEIEIDDDIDNDSSEYDNYKSSDSFIDDREIDDIYSDEITDDDNL